MHTYIPIKTIKTDKASKLLFILPAVTESKHIVRACQERMSLYQNSLMVQKEKEKQRLNIFLWLILAHTAHSEIDRNTNTEFSHSRIMTRNVNSICPR